jgi:hypothetical protein
MGMARGAAVKGEEVIERWCQKLRGVLTGQTPIEQHAHEARADLAALGEALCERPGRGERLGLRAGRAGALGVGDGGEVEVDGLDEERLGGAEVGEHAGRGERDAGHGGVRVVERRELVRPGGREGDGEEDLGGVVAVDARVREEGHGALCGTVRWEMFGWRNRIADTHVDAFARVEGPVGVGHLDELGRDAPLGGERERAPAVVDEVLEAEEVVEQAVLLEAVVRAPLDGGEQRAERLAVLGREERVGVGHAAGREEEVVDERVVEQRAAVAQVGRQPARKGEEVRRGGEQLERVGERRRGERRVRGNGRVLEGGQHGGDQDRDRTLTTSMAAGGKQVGGQQFQRARPTDASFPRIHGFGLSVYEPIRITYKIKHCCS